LRSDITSESSGRDHSQRGGGLSSGENGAENGSSLTAALPATMLSAWATGLCAFDERTMSHRIHQRR